MDSELTFIPEHMKKNSNSNMNGPTGIGLKLKEARESMNLSEKDAAARMHLSVKYISIMENEEFDSDLPPTFIRGYLRTYGRLLNLSETEINQAIHDLGITIPEPTPLASPSTTRLQDFDINEKYTHWVTYLLILVLIVLVGMWWTSHSNEKTIIQTPKPVVTPAAVTPTIIAPTSTTTPSQGIAITPAPLGTTNMGAGPTHAPVLTPETNSNMTIPLNQAKPEKPGTETTSPDVSTNSSDEEEQQGTAANSEENNSADDATADDEEEEEAPPPPPTRTKAKKRYKAPAYNYNYNNYYY